MLNFKTTQGLTLIELLLTIAILGLILWFSLPLSSSFYQKIQLQVIENEIKSAIRFAKTQALISGYPILLRTIDGSKGLTVCVDNMKHQCAPDDSTLQEWHWSYDGIDVDWSGFQSKQYLIFSADESKNAVNGYFSIKYKGRLVTKITLNRLGRVRVTNQFA